MNTSDDTNKICEEYKMFGRSKCIYCSNYNYRGVCKISWSMSLHKDLWRRCKFFSFKSTSLELVVKKYICKTIRIYIDK